MKFSPELKRTGITKNFYGHKPFEYIYSILHFPYIETFLKQKQYDLIRKFECNERTANKYEKYFKSIKVAFKNNYIIEDVTTWFDYLHLLEQYGKDIKSPRWICPPNLEKAHQKYVERARRDRRKVEIAEARKKLKKDTKDFDLIYDKFKGFKIVNGDYTIVVFDSLEQIMNESDFLNHCAYTNSYFRNNKRVLMSARYKGEVIETVDFNYIENKIVQIRGKNNRPTIHNENLRKIVENMSDLLDTHLKEYNKKKSKKRKPRKVKQQIAA